MRTKIFFTVIFIILNSSFLIHNCFSQWVQMNGIYGGSVYSVACNGNNIFAGTISNGVFHSTNFGITWLYTSLNNKTILSLSVNGNIIFAGTWSSGVYRSTDNGSNWIQTTLNNRNIRSLAISGNYIFAGTDGFGIYRSTDNGNTWNQTQLNTQNVLTLAINGNIIFAGTDSYGIYLSTDFGNNWVQTGLNNQTIISFLISENNIFAGTLDSGVWLSTNNGVSWIEKNQSFNPIPSVKALLIANDYIFAGTFGHSIWRRSLSEIIGIKNISTEIPSAFSLEQNYPNPFNQSTMFKFQCSKAGLVKISVYDITGKQVATLVNEKLNPGTYEVRFDVRHGGSSTELPSGIYFYRMETEKFSDTKKLVLLK